jgi:hypothetical protein
MNSKSSSENPDAFGDEIMKKIKLEYVIFFKNILIICFA